MDNQGTTCFEIMVVDDEPGDVDLIKLALTEGRFIFNVTVAVNGKEAMAMVRRQPPYSATPAPDLMLLDLNMPQMGGKEVLAEMKADPALAVIPVVVLTTSDVERDVVASYRLGAAGYVTKPVDVDALFAAIRGIQDYWFSVVRRPA